MPCTSSSTRSHYLGPVFGRMRVWRLVPHHFVERFGLIILIALGESIIAIGVGASGLDLDAGIITTAVLGFIVIACLWWSYFDWVVFVAQLRLVEATGSARARLAREAYSYLYLPIVGGIVLFAVGLETALHDAEHSLPVVPAFALAGGIAFYFVAHVLLRPRIGGGLGRGRPVASVVLVALFPLVTHISARSAVALVATVCVALVATVCVALIIYEVLRHHAERATIRARRGALVSDDIRSPRPTATDRRTATD